MLRRLTACIMCIALAVPARAADLSSQSDLGPSDFSLRKKGATPVNELNRPLAQPALNGADKNAHIVQAGAGNHVLAIQSGTASQLHIVQNGMFNAAISNQAGAGDVLDAIQTGQGNDFSIVQANKAHATIIQNGNFNAATVIQSSPGANISLWQYGQRLSVKLIQY